MMSSNVRWGTCGDFQQITIDNKPLLLIESPPYQFGKEGIFLILVLMEYGLGLTSQANAGNQPMTVLILVLMEYGLGQYDHKFNGEAWKS